MPRTARVSRRPADLSRPLGAARACHTAASSGQGLDRAELDRAQGVHPARHPTRLAILAAAVLALVGCQSAPPLAEHRAADADAANAALARGLAASIDALAQGPTGRENPARIEARHRALLNSHLPHLLNLATRPSPWSAPDAARLDPGELSQVDPIVRPHATPVGLVRAGIGLPIVARLPAPEDPNAPRAGYHLPATLVALPTGTPGDQPEPRGACCDTALVDPDQVQAVPTTAGTLPVAMDLYAPLAETRATGIRPMSAIGNLVRPGRFTGEPRIIFLAPFDPDKIPVVLVHGLLSTPGIWKPLVTQLLADPRIRDCCQLWFFYYPTGQPVPLSALQLRDALDDAIARTGPTRKLLLIGHSMGGILSRAQVSRIDAARAETILPGVSRLSDYSRVRRALIFEPRRDVSRVVFLFVPHQGSRLAANGFGALAIRLIRLPDTLLNEAEHAVEQLAGLESRRLPTSIHGLSPRSNFLRALSALTPTVPVHSILGNRGRGDGSTGSDGVVPVRSARVASAESEVVVPTGHGGFNHPDAVAEIKRIILLDAAERQANSSSPVHATANSR